MLEIEPITSRSSSELLDQTRALFRSYGDFLRTSGGPALFCFSRLEDEIADLPLTYADKGGEVLLARDGAQSAGCIAYRSTEPADPVCCEIKRLFVSSAFRGRGIGKRLVLTALERARQNGYRTALLDTEPTAMAIAKQMYLDLGFVLDDERNSRSENSLVTYLKKQL
jgi:ribosomal protein S18 acetylase RimI-like enzyme